MKLRPLLLAALALCAAILVRAADSVPPLVLISMDGFRWDYCAQHPAETPHLRELMRTGVSARGLIPVYPSNTFPNHYSIVTGLYPSHHGIVNNHMFDPQLGAMFHYNRAADVGDSRWWGGEPIWITAVKQGRPSATSFWVGSEAAVDGRRPTYWKRYDYRIPFAARLDELMQWLARPPDQRPAVVAFYFEETNSVGHRYGPDSPELAATLKSLDAQLGAMLARFDAAGLAVNVVVCSDHGMTPCGPDRVIVLDDYLDLSTVQVDFDESCAGLRPIGNTTVESVMKALDHLPAGSKAYRAQDLPARFHVDPRNPRVPPVWIVPAEGWNILRRAAFEAFKPKFNKGQHGYDPALPSMHGILVAHGPSFRNDGAVIDEVENVHIYNLLCAALHLQPAPNDGDDRLARSMLRR